MNDKDREAIRKALYKRFRSIGDARRSAGKRIIYSSPEQQQFELESVSDAELLRLEDRYLRCFSEYRR